MQGAWNGVGAVLELPRGGVRKGSAREEAAANYRSWACCLIDVFHTRGSRLAVVEPAVSC